MAQASTSSSPAEVQFGARRKRSAFSREKIDGWCEKGILGCVLAALIYGPLAIGAVRNSEFVIVAGLLMVGVALWIVRIWTRDQYRILWAPISWGALAFLGYALYRWQTADVEYFARIEIFRIVVYALLFFLLVDNCNRQETFQILLLSLVALGALISFYAIFQYLAEHQRIWHFDKPIAYKGRGSGTYICPNHLAGYLEMMTPISLAFVFTSRLKHLGKVFVAYAGVVMVAGLIVTLSRGGWLSAAVSLLFFFGVLIKNRDYRIPALIFFTLLSLGAVLAGANSWRAKARLMDLAQPQARTLYWRPAKAMWKDHLWTGVGPNHYDIRYRNYREHWQAQFRPLYTHNDYLNTLADYGIIGAMLILVTISLAAHGVGKTWKFVQRQNEISTKSSNRFAMVLGCSAGLIALLAHSFFDFNMHIPANAMIAILLLAVLTGHIRYATERFWVNPGIFGRILMTGVLLFSGGWVVIQAKNFGLEAHYLARTKGFSYRSEFRMNYLNKAHQIQPTNPETTLEIGDSIRQIGWEGEDGYKDYLRKSIPWFEKTIQLNPYDPYAYIFWGMALHWLDEPKKAGELMDKAISMDPKGNYIMGLYGWHLLQIGNLEEAWVWFKNAYNYSSGENKMAGQYMKIVERRLADPIKVR